MRARVRLEVRLEYCSKRAFHVLRNARSQVEDYISARCTRSPGVAGLVQRGINRPARLFAQVRLNVKLDRSFQSTTIKVHQKRSIECRGVLYRRHVASIWNDDES